MSEENKNRISFSEAMITLRDNELVRFRENLNYFTKSLEPTLKIMEETRASFSPIIQSVLKQQEILSEALRPQKTYFHIVPRERALTHSDIPDITDSVADKLLLKMKLAKRAKYKTSTQMVIILEKNALFLPDNPDNKILLRAAPKRLEMLVLLINAGNEFTATGDIRKYAGSANNETVRKELKTLNNRICNALALKQDVIECIPGNGYRINPIYTIRIKN